MNPPGGPVIKHTYQFQDKVRASPSDLKFCISANKATVALLEQGSAIFNFDTSLAFAKDHAWDVDFVPRADEKCPIGYVGIRDSTYGHTYAVELNAKCFLNVKVDTTRGDFLYRLHDGSPENKNPDWQRLRETFNTHGPDGRPLEWTPYVHLFRTAGAFTIS